jgi:hypothetical protein
MPRTKSFKPKDKKKFNNGQIKVLLESLQLYFLNNKNQLNQIYEIIENNDTRIKLALLDFFVTIYAKKHKCFIELPDDEYFYINDQYKNQLKSFTKKLFDPFKRNDKFNFKYDDIEFTTTVGQLNFLKWALKHGIVKYIEDNFEPIQRALHIYQEDKKLKKIKC